MRRVLLLGGGHTHLVSGPLLAALAGGTASVGLVAPSPRLLYSGMMPGWLAGQYAFDDCAIDLAAVCARSGIDWIRDRIVDVDFAARVALGVHASYPFDLASINVGSDNGLGELDADVRAGGGPLAGSRVTLATSGDRLLPGMSSLAALKARGSLQAHGVELSFGTG
ncbi:MAG TPA: hypothetical protein VN324_13570, partial [Quisquiliibacterium sp.]|nr:hypothetical protein [Quisquiliibacterium sp.]